MMKHSPARIGDKQGRMYGNSQHKGWMGRGAGVAWRDQGPG